MQLHEVVNELVSPSSVGWRLVTQLAPPRKLAEATSKRQARMPYEVTISGDGAYAIRRAANHSIIALGEIDLEGLNSETAAGYLYALDLVDAAHGVLGKSRLRMAIERAFKSNSERPVTSVLDIVVAVRWMLPSLQCPDEVLILFLKRIAAERNLILQE